MLGLDIPNLTKLMMTTMIISIPSVVVLTAFFISLWGGSIRFNSRCCEINGLVFRTDTSDRSGSARKPRNKAASTDRLISVVDGDWMFEESQETRRGCLECTPGLPNLANGEISEGQPPERTHRRPNSTGIVREQAGPNY